MKLRTNIDKNNFGINGRYGITEAKKTDLDALTIEVLNAQGEVEQLQAIVTALTQKSANFTAFLNASENSMNRALSNKTFGNDVVQNATDLEGESKVAFIQMAIADNRIQEVCDQLNVVMNKLIYSAEVVNKLANTVIKEKTINPLISDELITIIGVAGQDANNAVALCLVALQSAFAAQASNGNAEAAAALEFNESVLLLDVITGESSTAAEELKNSPESNDLPDSIGSIISLLEVAYTQSVDLYQDAGLANTATTEQLEYATTNLTRAQNNLQSLQAGLAAANAAALAS